VFKILLIGEATLRLSWTDSVWIPLDWITAEAGSELCPVFQDSGQRALKGGFTFFAFTLLGAGGSQKGEEETGPTQEELPPRDSSNPAEN